MGRPWLCSNISLFQTPADRVAPIWDVDGLVVEEKEEMAGPYNGFVLLFRRMIHDFAQVHGPKEVTWLSLISMGWENISIILQQEVVENILKNNTI